MKRNELLKIINDLAQSQGFYGRLQRQLDYLRIKHKDIYEDLMQEWERKDFKDSVDFVIYLEEA